MTVIAMTREMGSRGRDVALRLAEDLGLDLVQHQLVEHVADKMHVGEASVNRFLEGKAGLLERWGINEQKLSLYTTEEILDVAAKGNVLIRGWGAAYVLRKVPHVLCLRICASEATRANVLMKRIGIQDINVAMKEIRANDAAHTRTMVHMFHVQDWGNPRLYDAVFNTDSMSIDTCVACARSIIEQPEFRQTRESEALLCDMTLTAHIESALKTNAATSNFNPSFEFSVRPGTGEVVLDGMVYDDSFVQAATQVVEGVDGVTAVDNRLRVLSHSAIGGP
jgi:cytidylate kinase